MKRLDNDKASLVDFMRSIKFRPHAKRSDYAVADHFAGLRPQARQARGSAAEEKLLVRSAN